MNVSGASSSDPVAQSVAAQKIERAALVMKKQHDVVQDTAQAMLQLIQQATPGDTGRLISAYA